MTPAYMTIDTTKSHRPVAKVMLSDFGIAPKKSPQIEQQIADYRRKKRGKGK